MARLLSWEGAFSVSRGQNRIPRQLLQRTLEAGQSGNYLMAAARRSGLKKTEDELTDDDVFSFSRARLTRPRR